MRKRTSLSVGRGPTISNGACLSSHTPASFLISRFLSDLQSGNRAVSSPHFVSRHWWRRRGQAPKGEMLTLSSEKPGDAVSHAPGWLPSGRDGEGLFLSKPLGVTSHWGLMSELFITHPAVVSCSISYLLVLTVFLFKIASAMDSNCSSTNDIFSHSQNRHYKSIPGNLRNSRDIPFPVIPPNTILTIDSPHGEKQTTRFLCKSTSKKRKNAQ